MADVEVVVFAGMSAVAS